MTGKQDSGYNQRTCILQHWELEYETMLTILNLPSLSQIRKFITMYKIINSYIYFSCNIFFLCLSLPFFTLPLPYGFPYHTLLKLLPLLAYLKDCYTTTLLHLI